MSYQGGNAIRLTAQFKDWDGENVEPDLVKVIIYDRNYKKLQEHSIGQANRLDTGLFYFDLVINEGLYVYEWYSEIDGLPSLKRNLISISKM
ncbi:MAG: hypothetical protein SCK28_04555 [Bacillota bacterium]|nr:hypothetical protein [Bacillota bacterium]